jgi:hypothetical protein
MPQLKGYPASDVALLGAVYHLAGPDAGDHLAVESVITLPWNR